MHSDPSLLEDQSQCIGCTEEIIIIKKTSTSMHSMHQRLRPQMLPHRLLLQARRRDFSRSSQSLPHLHSIPHATHHFTHPASPPAGPPDWQNTLQCRDPCNWQNLPDWQNTLLPRDPSWALPHPHQRPATATACNPPAFAHAAPQSQQWLDPSQTPQYPGHQAAPPTLSSLPQRHCFVGTHQSHVGPASTCGDDRAAALHPHHLYWGFGQGVRDGDGDGFLPQDWHQRQGAAHSHGRTPLPSAHTAASFRPTSAEHALDAWGDQNCRMSQPASEAQYIAAGLHSQRTSRRCFPQPVSEHLCVHGKAPVHQHEHLSQQPQTAHCTVHAAVHEPFGSGFDWSACLPAARHCQEPVGSSHQRAAGRDTVLKQEAPAAAFAAQGAGPPHLRQGGPVRRDQHMTDAGGVAAMETVLSEYKALRSQISEAEAQLLDLQRAQPNYDADGRRQPSSCSNEHITSVGPSGEVGSRGDQGRDSGVDRPPWRELTNTLRALKAAAAKQRPAVEAVANQLRSTLSRVHAASITRANE